MKNKIGLLFMGLGTVLILSALSLFLWNRWEDQRAGEAAEQVVSQLEIYMEEVVSLSPPATEAAPEIFPEIPMETTPIDPTMTEVEVDGNLYIGYVMIPAYGLKLPVMSTWSYRQLNTAPCRYTGSTKTDDLVVMAHNYSHHFGQLKNLTAGDLVEFMDMDGILVQYEVVGLETLMPTSIEDMTAGEYDLTLFTCTYGGKSRVTVRCNRILNESDWED